MTYANDFTKTGKITSLRKECDTRTTNEPEIRCQYEYNASKPFLLVKEGTHTTAGCMRGWRGSEKQVRVSKIKRKKMRTRKQRHLTMM